MCFSQKCTNVSQIWWNFKTYFHKEVQANKNMLVLLMFPLGNENVIIELSLNIENFLF